MDSRHSPQEATDDRPFRHYTLKQRVTSWVSQALFDRVTYTVRHGLLTGMRRRGGLGWLPASLAGAATPEIAFFQTLDVRDKVVYDVGAFQGLMTLWFARQASAVVSFEPNSRNRKRLLENLSLNQISNVTVRPCGIGSQPGTGVISFLPLMAGGGSLDPETIAQLKLHSATAFEQVTISTLDVERDSAKLPPPDFIKIDVEGFELEALQGAQQTLRECRPELYLEMHGETTRAKRKNVTRIVEFLVSVGYTSIHHVETATAITPDNATAAMEGHLCCRHGGAA